MQTLRKILYKIGGPDSKHPLALFHHCDIAVTHQMSQLGSLMKTTPDNLDRRSVLIRQLKDSQHNLINVFSYLVESAIPDLRNPTEFRLKYPEDMQTELFHGSIWFGAECLAAGSQIANHEIESLELRPYAIRLSKSISLLRQALREESHQYYYQQPLFSERVKELLRVYDKCWVEFEYSYVNIMYNTKTKTQYFHQQEIAVLFAEATQRALLMKYFTEDMLEMMDPMVMFAIPRLAIVCGLAINTDGPINPKRSEEDIPACFKEYNHILKRIQERLGLLNEQEIITLERLLCSTDSIDLSSAPQVTSHTVSSSSTGSSNSTIKPLSTREQEFIFQSLPIMDEGNAPSSKDSSAHEFAMSYQSPSESIISSASNLTETSLSGFTSNQYLIQRLFVAISGVADQLQSNYSRDFRAIMKQAYTFSLSEPESDDTTSRRTSLRLREKFDMPSDCFTFDLSLTSLMSSPTEVSQDWVADSESPCCHACKESFSFFRRRHHCRTCGEVVCNDCSPHYLPSIQEEEEKLLRVCNGCYIRELGKLTRSLAERSSLSQVTYNTTNYVMI